MKAYYLIRDSSINIYRTKGIIFSFILSLLVSIISFFCFFLFLFFSKIQKSMMAHTDSLTDMTEKQMSAGPIIGISIFKVAILIITVAMIFLTMGNIKKSFYQFYLTQKNEYKTMTLLGETSVNLAIYYSLQVLIFSIVTIFLGMSISLYIFYASVIETLKLSSFSTDIIQFQVPILAMIGVALATLVYLFVTSFLKVYKKSCALVDSESN